MIFEARDLGYAQDGRPVLRDVGFSIGPGERVVVLGVNGCGKTTLLRMLDGLLFPTSGSLRYAGSTLDARALEEAAFRRRFRGEVGFLFQNVDAMLFHASVADEIAFGPRQLGMADVDERVLRWAGALGLEPLLARPPFELSGGEKKRVALASLLVCDPKVLLLDEATANLDPAWSARLVDLLAARRDLTVVAATHNLSVAQELGDRAILVGPAGEGLLHDGPTAALLRDPELLVRSGLAHRHLHAHDGSDHAHFHVHDVE
ncbi:MAG: ABC transporter ATP-binding protein [Deltaproteobacteria bacterium]